MNLEKLAKVLKCNTEINPKEIKEVREKYDMSIYSAKDFLLEKRILKKIEILVEKINK